MLGEYSPVAVYHGVGGTALLPEVDHRVGHEVLHAYQFTDKSRGWGEKGAGFASILVSDFSQIENQFSDNSCGRV